VWRRSGILLTLFDPLLGTGFNHWTLSQIRELIAGPLNGANE
jgi:hypothetical protein